MKSAFSSRSLLLGLAVLSILAVLIVWAIGSWKNHSLTQGKNAREWQARLPTLRQSKSLPISQGDDKLPEGYVGAQACWECHPGQYKSFLETSHSRSATLTSAENSPQDIRFNHAKSNREYQVFRDHEQLVHRESILDVEQEVIAVTEAAMKYTIGSGEHAQSFLFESDGFLIESPLTWFAEPNRWEMSPGFDYASHKSFRRGVNEECLFCHVGQVRRETVSQPHPRIVELQIGCERCHGPGARHVKDVNARQATLKGENLDNHVIVNPAKLTREIGEAICQQCHLQGVVHVTGTGKGIWDFRPGQSIVDSRTDFQTVGKSKQKIVGHVEQMHQSECYKKSDTLTCISCHDPHHSPPTANKQEYYRNSCLKCHTNDSCRVPMDSRLIENENSCALCHMPKQPTNVAHAALHNHRIGVHRKEPEETIMKGRFELRSLIGDQSLTEDERLRRHALALHYFMNQGDLPKGFLNQSLLPAMQTLLQLRQRGQSDALADTSLGWDAMVLQKFDQARALAGSSVAMDPSNLQVAIDSHGILGQLAFKSGNPANALTHYRSLTQYRCDANDRYMLALCESNLGHLEAAVLELEKALVLQPDLAEAHELLAKILFATGKQELAELHRQFALKLPKKQE